MLLGAYLLLNFAVMWIVARESVATGWRLAAMLFVLGFVVGSLNSLIEALFFHILGPGDLAPAAIATGIVFALLSCLAMLSAGRWRTGAQPPLPGRFTPLSLAGVVVAYEVLYWTAGTLVFPYVSHFYAGRSLPHGYEVAAMQVVRSLIFASAAYPLLRTGLRSAPLMLALVFSIIGGAAPLLIDNPYLPPDIRFYHGIETTSSNFLFGLAVGFLFNRGRRRAAQ